MRHSALALTLTLALTLALTLSLTLTMTRARRCVENAAKGTCEVTSSEVSPYPYP